jgi:hypothetical protein
MGKKKDRDEVELFFEPDVDEDELPVPDQPPAANALLVTVDFMALEESHGLLKAYEIVGNLRDLLR